MVEKQMHDDELTDRVREIIATIFDIPLDEVTVASSPDTVEHWDSLGRLLLAIELEQEFGVVVPPEDCERLTSVGAIAMWLSENTVSGTPAQAVWAR
jgi:acyl carrier protein